MIHLGHDRGADEVARAAIQEDAHAVAITSYQGGAVEMFTHTSDILEDSGFGHVFSLEVEVARFSLMRLNI